MCTWSPEAGGASPDALDACVHGVLELANLTRETRDGRAAITGAVAAQAAVQRVATQQRKPLNVAAVLSGRGGSRI
jgi:hypothetical protein